MLKKFLCIALLGSFFGQSYGMDINKNKSWLNLLKSFNPLACCCNPSHEKVKPKLESDTSLYLKAKSVKTINDLYNFIASCGTKLPKKTLILLGFFIKNNQSQLINKDYQSFYRTCNHIVNSTINYFTNAYFFDRDCEGVTEVTDTYYNKTADNCDICVNIVDGNKRENSLLPIILASGGMAAAVFGCCYLICATGISMCVVIRAGYAFYYRIRKNNLADYTYYPEVEFVDSVPFPIGGQIRPQRKYDDNEFNN